MPRNLWTDAERERLRHLAATGMSHKAIAAELGRKPSAITQELYNQRHPGRRAEIVDRHMAKYGAEALHERGRRHYQEHRPQVVAQHRNYYQGNKAKVLTKQAQRRAAQPERIRAIRAASRERHRPQIRAQYHGRYAVRRAREGDSRALAKLTGLCAADVLFWLPRLPQACTAARIVDKLRQIAAIREPEEGATGWAFPVPYDGGRTG